MLNITTIITESGSRYVLDLSTFTVVAHRAEGHPLGGYEHFEHKGWSLEGGRVRFDLPFGRSLITSRVERIRHTCRATESVTV